MEIFLLLLDELDDASAVLRSLLPRLAGFLVALGLFVLTVAVVMFWPVPTALVVLTGAAVAWFVAPGFRPQFGVKTDP